MRETQHQIIIRMCLDGEWKCQNEFRRNYIFSPHKRRSEIEAVGRYKFTRRKCQHGITNQFDYKMIPNKDYVPIPPKKIDILQESLK